MLKALMISALVCGQVWGMDSEKGDLVINERIEGTKIQIFEPKPCDLVTCFKIFKDMAVIQPTSTAVGIKLLKLHLTSLETLNNIDLLLSKIDFNNLPEGNNNRLPIQPSESQPTFKLTVNTEPLTEKNEMILGLIPSKEVISRVGEKAEIAAKHYEDFRTYFNKYLIFQRHVQQKFEEILSQEKEFIFFKETKNINTNTSNFDDHVK